MKEKIIKYTKIVLFISMLVLSFIASEKVAAFLAVLELLKLGVITINQTEAFAPIYIFLRQGER